MAAAEQSKLEGLPLPGEVLLGKYRLERVLGAGGMGAVFSAKHLALGQRVAIKFLRGQAATDPAVVERFSREAWAASRIQSEHVARVTDVGTTSQGVPFLVMEHLSGEDLESLVSRGPLPVRDAVQYLLQAGEALAEAHQLGIVHRDLKPGNLFVTRRADGSAWIKVLDFGISKIAGAAKLTETSALVGSPLYMAPEHLRAEPIDQRADIWGLGVILFELLVGEPPFGGESLPQICTQILHGKPKPLRRSDVPAGLVRVVMRCLEKLPDDRYADLGELALALSPFAGDEGQGSVRFIKNVAERASIEAMPTLTTEVPPGSLDHPELAQSSPDADDDSTVRAHPGIGRKEGRLGSSTDVPVSTQSIPRRNGLVGLVVGLSISLIGALALYAILSGPEGETAADVPERLAAGPGTEPGVTAESTASAAPVVSLGASGRDEEAAPALASAAPSASAATSASATPSASAAPVAAKPPPKKNVATPKKPPPPPKKNWSPFDDR